MQLAIIAQKSKFLKFSDKFNHFIYELQRAKFGPIAELCKIYMVNDPKEQFYRNKIISHHIFQKAIHYDSNICNVIKK